MKKSINYWAVPGGGDGSKDIGEFLSEAKAAGFEAVELCYGEAGELSMESGEAACRAVAEKAKDIGIEIGSVATGLFWKYSLTSDDPAMREKAKDVVRKGVQIAAWTGTDALLVVPGVVCAPISGEQVQYEHALYAGDVLSPAEVVYPASTKYLVLTNIPQASGKRLVEELYPLSRRIIRLEP